MSEQPKTAYEQSVAVGYALLNQLSAEQEAQEKAAEIQRLHKRAFRVAYDLLEKLWPPENTPEYWKEVTDRMALDYHDNRENKLCGILMLAVEEYLEKVSKGEDDGDREGTEALAFINGSNAQ